MTKGHRFQSLDAWRGICALLVAVEHLNTTSVLRHNGFIHHAYRFVDFFFVLSGFVIAHAYREPLQRGAGAVRSFLVRRLGRLWPLHVTVLLTLIAVECMIAIAARAGVSLGHAAFTDKNTLATIPANLALVHGWGMYPNTTWNGPSWSISTEAFAYMAFAAICALVPGRWIGRTAVVILIGSAAIVLFVAPQGMASTYDYALFRCLFGFMTGVLARSAWGRFAPRLGTIGELAVIAAVVAGVALLPKDGPALLITPLFAVAVWVFASEDGALSRAMNRRWPQALGAWSYSIYMVHVVIALGILLTATIATKHGVHLVERVDGLQSIVGSAGLTALITFGYLGTVVLLSSLTYRYIELPGQRWFGRRAHPQPAKVAEACL